MKPAHPRWKVIESPRVSERFRDPPDLTSGRKRNVTCLTKPIVDPPVFISRADSDEWNGPRDLNSGEGILGVLILPLAAMSIFFLGHLFATAAREVFKIIDAQRMLSLLLGR